MILVIASLLVAPKFIGAVVEQEREKTFLSKLGMAPMVDNFVEQGYLTKQDNDISFAATYIQNQLTLNGKAFQL